MFQSIADDIKGAFSYGHMVTKLIIVNVAIFIVLALIEAFTRNLGIYQPIIDNIAMPTKAIELLYKPWTIFTYMFVHESFWHLLWNMIGLNIFGKIVGDLLGDRKVFPIYILGGLVGAILLVAVAPLMPNIGFGNMRGASAGILAIAMVGALVAPDYNIRLLLIGNVRLKYIVLAFIVFDLISSQGYNNAGGHIAHLGGMIMGFLFVYALRQGKDLSNTINNVVDWVSGLGTSRQAVRRKSPVLKVEHRSEKLTQPSMQATSSASNHLDFDDELDRILEKIKQKGYNKLNKEEKDFLNKASQK